MIITYYLFYFNSTKVQFGESDGRRMISVHGYFNSTKVQFGVIDSTPAYVEELISIPLRYNLETKMTTIEKLQQLFQFH